MLIYDDFPEHAITKVEIKLKEDIEQSLGTEKVKHIRLGMSDTMGIMAGYHGVINGQWLYNETLWVEKTFRGRGIGKGLLQQAENTASDSFNCKFALSLCIGDAAKFFIKMGYQQSASFANWRGHHHMSILWKSL